MSGTGLCPACDNPLDPNEKITYDRETHTILRRVRCPSCEQAFFLNAKGDLAHEVYGRRAP